MYSLSPAGAAQELEEGGRTGGRVVVAVGASLGGRWAREDLPSGGFTPLGSQARGPPPPKVEK